MLEDFVLANKIGAQLFESEKEIHGAGKLASLCGLSIESTVKCVLFVGENSLEPVLVVFLATSKPSIPLLELASGFSGLLPATEKESLEMTGFESGRIPPVSVYGIKTFIDKKVLEKEFVAASGGDAFHALKIPPKEIQEFGFEAETAEIAE